MTSKERMLLALNMEKPDRLPATIHQWQPYHLQTYMGGMDDIEAFRAVGLDAAVTVIAIKDVETPQWEHVTKKRQDGLRNFIDHVILTPEGTLTYTQEYNEYTVWITDHMVKNDEDIYLIKKYMPVPQVDAGLIAQKYDELGDDGIIRIFINGFQGGCWQDACELFGTEQLIYAAYDKPEWVHEFMEILLNKKLAFIEKNMQGLKVDLVETGGGASSNTVISPAMHEEYCLPYDRKIHDALHTMGYKVVYHTCGGMMGLLDLIPQNGCDASETLSPPGVGGDITDPPYVKNTLGRKVALIGGLDQINVLSSTPDKIRGEVFRLFEGFGQGGGYIMSASDHFFHASRENIEAYAKAAKECVY